ncbi:hypothetical protein BDC45DRAFT_534642 [Circinella umbellata]|nr:hypothetical protein BDC45DRAFT_534642 [Circinella umbellata]
MSTTVNQHYTLDPLYTIPVKLFIYTVLSLVNFENRRGHYLLNKSRVIREAEICGIIIALEQTYNMIIYTIDDTTGTIRCCQWKKHPGQNNKLYRLGTCLLIRGYLGDFMNDRQITIQHIDIVRDPNREILHDLQTIYLYENVYNKPFQLFKEIENNIQFIQEELNNIRKESFWQGVVTSSQKTDIDDNDKVDITEELFQEHMLSFFKETNGINDKFSYSAAYGDNYLVELAAQVYMKEYGHDEATDTEINEMFARAFYTYKKKGIMIEREKDGLYSFVNDNEVVLWKIILKLD